MVRRLTFIAVSASATALALAAVAPASASLVPGLGAGGRVAPAARIVDDVLDGVSCTTQPDNPSVKSVCTAVGSFADGQFVSGQVESSVNGKWGGNIFGGLRRFTEPLEVSCVAQQDTIPACLAVGQDFSKPDSPVQLVAAGDANGFTPVQSRNPKGTTFSVLDDVSCASTSFCMLVGAAGTTKLAGGRRIFLPHATVYRWNGSGLTAMTIPAPAHARNSELAGVSCPSATTCMAVGGYDKTTGGVFAPYSALWTSGAWHVRAAPLVGGVPATEFEAVSCGAATDCVAVGLVQRRSGSAAFATHFTRGAWHLLHAVPEPKSVFFSVSCPQVSVCVAAGHHGSRSLIEAWNGAKWTVAAVPVTPAPLSTDALFHVSCLSASICTAVGYRHDPASKFSFRTLALGWNGAKWSIQKTISE